LIIGEREDLNFMTKNKFKWISGDFVAEYNMHLDKLHEKQAQLDEEFKNSIGSAVEREISRLENTIPVDFSVGSRVVNSHGNEGIIISTHVELVVETHAETDSGQPAAGPNRYWPIRSANDEDVVTCEGMLRLYVVEFDSHDLEKDWGVEKKAFSMYSDEFELVEEHR